MADNLFQPQVATVNSAVTPQQGVADTSAVDLFADVAKTATEATFAFTGQAELSSLKKKFGNIVQARQAGGNSTTLQLKARTALDEARANSPWVAPEAEKLFRETFSGGGSTGAFKATPQEQAKADYIEKVETYRLERNLPSEEVAAQQISLEENAKAAKLQADNQKNVREYNGDVVSHSNKLQVSNQSVKFMDVLMNRVGQTGGTLSNEDVRNFDLTIEQEVRKMEQEFLSQTRDSKTGHVLIDNNSLKAGLKEIEDFGTYARNMVKDNTMTKVFTDLRAELTATNKILIAKKMPTLTAIHDSLGQGGVSEYIRLAEMSEGVAKNLIINPATAPLFEIAGSFTASATEGVSKVLVPTPGGLTLTQSEAIATGTVLNDPTRFNFVQMMLEDSGVESTAPVVESMLEQNPDSAALYWSERTKAWAAANPPKAKRALEVGLKGIKRSFDRASASNQSFPTNLSLQFKPRGGALIAKGDGITSEHTAAIRSTFKMFKEYPEFLKQFGIDNGAPDITAKEATESYLTGQPILSEEALALSVDAKVTPNKGRSAARASQRTSKPTSEVSDTITPPKGVDESQGFTEADLDFMIGEGKITEDDATLFRERGLVDKPKEATQSKEALMLQPFIDKGFTKEQMLETLSSLGFAKNGLNDRMKAIIEESFNG